MGLGWVGMSAFDGNRDKQDKQEVIAIIHQVLDLGITLLDVADVYGPFTNEELGVGPFAIGEIRWF